MDETIDRLLIDVRADTQGFRSDVEAMRSAFDTTLVDGFAQAGNVLERGLLSAIKRGSLGFDDLKRTALQAINEIAAQALQLGLDRIFAGSNGGGSSGLSAILNSAASALFGLPGRALGGPVSPATPYLVGERGPELFVPTSAGRIEPNAVGGQPRDVRVSISLPPARGAAAPASLQRSARQVASSVRRALVDS